MKIKTSFDFDAAHRLVGYEGKCSRLHGHIWHVEIEVEGKESQIDDTGILWDFTKTKKLKNFFDHKTILKEDEENKKLYNLLAREDPKQVILMNTNPTTEHIAYWFYDCLKVENPKLKFKVTVWENSKSNCEVGNKI